MQSDNALEENVPEVHVRPNNAAPASDACIVSHLQETFEAERVALARTLHDELGGLMVSAAMDVAWAEQHLASAEDVRERLRRIRATLASAIDLKRNLIENLRPTLLDNFGLFAAFRWHVSTSCQKAGIACTHEYPEDEMRLSPTALTGLFRIMQESLAITFAERAVESVAVMVEIDDDQLQMEIGHQHSEGITDFAPDLVSPLMGSMTNRVGALGGSLKMMHHNTGNTSFLSRYPIVNLLTDAA